MNGRVAAGLGLMVMLLACSDASALCGGGGMSGFRGGGGVLGVSGGGGHRKAEKKFQKWELPAAVEPAKLDTSRFDSLASTLGLSDEQLAKIDAAKKEIRATAEKLAKAQNEARSAYAECPGELTCTSAARDVASAASACKSYDPNRQFESTVAVILTADQRAKYREAVMKKS